nr:hypothetical protein [uncultured Sphingosinicella sp.]
MRAYWVGPAAALALLAGCGGGGGEGGVTADESKQLNEAADMLDASADSLVAPDETGLGNGEAGSNEADAAAEANATTDGGAEGNGAANAL